MGLNTLAFFSTLLLAGEDLIEEEEEEEEGLCRVGEQRRLLEMLIRGEVDVEALRGTAAGACWGWDH